MKGYVEGVGINDSVGSVYSVVNGKRIVRKSYVRWKDMLRRCYNKSVHAYEQGVTVCDDWLLFSNFEKWFDEHYVEGMNISVRLLNKGVKEYNPETVIFAPQSVISFVSDKQLGPCLVGVNFKNNRFQARIKLPGHKDSTFLGNYNTEHEAHEAWRVSKIALLKSMKDLLDTLHPCLYTSLKQRYE